MALPCCPPFAQGGRGGPAAVPLFAQANTTSQGKEGFGRGGSPQASRWVRWPDSHTLFAFLHTTCRVREHSTTAQALGPAAALPTGMMVISALRRNNTPPKLQKSPGEIAGVRKTVPVPAGLPAGTVLVYIAAA